MKSNRKKTISIVTPSFNQGPFIEETLVSVLSQKGDFFLDYIVVDGGSTDETVDILRKYDSLLQTGGWQAECLGIRFRWMSEKDRGQSDALNKGFALAEGRVLGWLNSDDVFYPGALQLVSSVNWRWSHFCYGEGMWISQSGQEICRYPTFKPTRNALQVKCTLCQPTVFFRKDVKEALGDLSLEYYCAFDYEYWLRAAAQGKRFAYIPNLLAKSRMYQQNKSLANQERVATESIEVRGMHYRQSRIPLLTKLHKIERCRVEQSTTVQETMLAEALSLEA